MIKKKPKKEREDFKMIKVDASVDGMFYTYLYRFKRQNEIEAVISIEIPTIINKFFINKKIGCNYRIAIKAIDDYCVDDIEIYQNINNNAEKSWIVKNNVEVYKYAIKEEGKVKKWKVLYSLTKLH